MKIVNMLGGLGNQMFVYAFYLALKEAHPTEELLLCKRSYNGYPLHNGYELDRIFGIQANEPTLWQLSRLAYPFWNYRSWQVTNHLLPRRKSMSVNTTSTPYNSYDVERNASVFYDGYWQNENYFKQIKRVVLDTFRFPEFMNDKNRQLADILKGQKAVSCHVRRGDYLKQRSMCVCTPEYYASAIRNMNDLVKPDLYCVFSDDIMWCKENIGKLCNREKVIYVDWNNAENSYRDMQLMSLCNYNIIANSSFSWWGAWLNQHTDKVVMSPKKWMNEKIINDPICDDWIRI